MDFRRTVGNVAGNVAGAWRAANARLENLIPPDPGDFEPPREEVVPRHTGRTDYSEYQQEPPQTRYVGAAAVQRPDQAPVIPRTPTRTPPPSGPARPAPSATAPARPASSGVAPVRGPARIPVTPPVPEIPVIKVPAFEVADHKKPAATLEEAIKPSDMAPEDATPVTVIGAPAPARLAAAKLVEGAIREKSVDLYVQSAEPEQKPQEQSAVAVVVAKHEDKNASVTDHMRRQDIRVEKVTAGQALDALPLETRVDTLVSIAASLVDDTQASTVEALVRGTVRTLRGAGVEQPTIGQIGDAVALQAHTMKNSDAVSLPLQVRAQLGKAATDNHRAPHMQVAAVAFQKLSGSASPDTPIASSPTEDDRRPVVVEISPTGHQPEALSALGQIATAYTKHVGATAMVAMGVTDPRHASPSNLGSRAVTVIENKPGVENDCQRLLDQTVVAAEGVLPSIAAVAAARQGPINRVIGANVSGSINANDSDGYGSSNSRAAGGPMSGGENASSNKSRGDGINVTVTMGAGPLVETDFVRDTPPHQVSVFGGGRQAAAYDVHTGEILGYHDPTHVYSKIVVAVNATADRTRSNVQAQVNTPPPSVPLPKLAPDIPDAGHQKHTWTSRGSSICSSSGRLTQAGEALAWSLYELYAAARGRAALSYEDWLHPDIFAATYGPTRTQRLTARLTGQQAGWREP